jgi:aryl-alcohol dehydrogenase-like predicted oxidoreductase
MQKRKLGATGLELTVLGMGGFHLVEVPLADATLLLNTYLDEGGNYVETAASYGDGISEQKIGRAIGHRRDSFLLASKTMGRTAEALRADLDRSLANLATDHLDILFIHCLQRHEELEAISAPGGALEAAQAAQAAGKVRCIGVTGHGRPDALLEAIDRFPFAALMTGFNYLDRFNYPAVERDLVPRASAKGIGLLAMKPLADGYLYRSAEPAMRYVLGLPVASVVAGANTMELLRRDIALVQAAEPLPGPDREELFRTAPELGDYVCRLCGLCRESTFDPEEVFLLEGLFDRQMDDGRVPDAARYALRERLKHWFDQAAQARLEYAALARKVDPAADYRHLNVRCPYGIDIDRKLKLAHGKLSADRYLA